MYFHQLTRMSAVKESQKMCVVLHPSKDFFSFDCVQPGGCITLVWRSKYHFITYICIYFITYILYLILIIVHPQMLISCQISLSFRIAFHILAISFGQLITVSWRNITSLSVVMGNVKLLRAAPPYAANTG